MNSYKQCNYAARSYRERARALNPRHCKRERSNLVFSKLISTIETQKQR